MKWQRGFLSIAAVVMIIVFGILMAAVVRLFMSGSESSARTMAGNESYNLANAGIEVGLYNLKSSLVCDGTVTTVTLTTGVYTYMCTTYSPASTTLAAGITDTSTTISLADSTGYAPLGAITIGSETIYYNSISGNNLLNVRRGQNGSTAAAASSGSVVTQNEYVITAVGYVPNQSSPIGKTTLQQAVSLQNGGYFAGGAGGSFYQSNPWRQLPDIGTLDVNAMACSSLTQCFAGGNSGSFFKWSGTSWSAMPSVGTLNILSMACPTSNLCFAAGNNGQIYSYNGSSWATAGSVGSGVTIQAMGCASATRCFAASSAGRIYTWVGGAVNAWSLHTTISPNSPNFKDIACPSASVCFVLGNTTGGRVYKWTSGTNAFSLDYSAAGSRTIDSIACPTSSNCQMGGRQLRVYQWNGSSWSEGAQAGNGSFTLDSMACASALDCRAGDTQHRFYIWNAATNTWSFEINLGGNKDINAMVAVIGSGAVAGIVTFITRN